MPDVPPVPAELRRPLEESEFRHWTPERGWRIEVIPERRRVGIGFRGWPVWKGETLAEYMSDGEAVLS